MSNFINLFLKGILLGVANVIPGVSGGTIAVVLRIFEPLVEAVNSFFKAPKKHIKLLLPLVFGAIVGILLFSKVLAYSLQEHSFITSVFFVGLVAGSIPLIYKEAKSKPVKPIYFLVSVLVFLVVVSISLLKEPTSSLNINNINLLFLAKVFLFSIISSSAMVIPGISGSFVMVLLGVYNLILTSISNFSDTVLEGIKMIPEGFLQAALHILKSDSFKILAVAGVGIIFGIILISKVIAILLEKMFSITYFSIIGLIFGSIFSIFADSGTYVSHPNGLGLSTIVFSILFFLLGAFISIKISKD